MRILANGETQVDVTEIRKAAPSIGLSGGPYAESALLLFDAIQFDKPEMARSIIERDPKIVRHVGELLLGAVSHRSRQITELVLRAGAEVGTKDDLGMTALHWAAAYGSAEIAASLLAFGADGSVLSSFLVTAPELAAINGHDPGSYTLAGGNGRTAISPAAILERIGEAVAESEQRH